MGHFVLDVIRRFWSKWECEPWRYAHHRASRSSSTYKRGPTDTYSCTRFQPDLPPGETNETVEHNRQRLEEIYRLEGAGGVERVEVKNLMEHTFCRQRRHINALPWPDIEDLRSKWPFLFTQSCIYAHFELFTDNNVVRSLEHSMEECGRAITEYFRGKPTNKDVKDVLSNREDNVLLHGVKGKWRKGPNCSGQNPGNHIYQGTQTEGKRVVGENTKWVSKPESQY